MPVIIQPVNGCTKYKNTKAIPENTAPTMCANCTACSSKIILLELISLSIVNVYSNTKGALFTLNIADKTSMAKHIATSSLLCKTMESHSNVATPYLQKLKAPFDTSVGLYSFIVSHPSLFLYQEKAFPSFACILYNLQTFAKAASPLA